MLAIPKDAPHVANAHLFINYLMNPQVIASITNAVGFANAIPVSSPLLNASIASDTAIYPTPDEQQHLFVQAEDPLSNRAPLLACGRSSRPANSKSQITGGSTSMTGFDPLPLSHQ